MIKSWFEGQMTLFGLVVSFFNSRKSRTPKVFSSEQVEEWSTHLLGWRKEGLSVYVRGEIRSSILDM